MGQSAGHLHLLTHTHKTPRHSFGTAARPGLAPDDDGAPGPGSYKLPSTLLRPGVGFSLRGRVRFNSMYRDDDRREPGKAAASSVSSPGPV